MKILIENRQRRHLVMARLLRKKAEMTLNALELPESELSVSIVGDRTIRKLNREYLGKDKPTNVISFAMQEGPFADLNAHVLGDVVISADTAAREAAEGNISFENRMIFLLLHGILHLAGYDHERSGEAEAIRMEEKEREIFKLLQE